MFYYLLNGRNVMDNNTFKRFHLKSFNKMAVVVTVLLLSCFAAAEDRLLVPANRLSHSLATRESLAQHYWPSDVTPKYRQDLAASVCVGQSLLTRYSRDSWSKQMWDSSGTSVVGMYAGAHQARGHQQLCTEVSEQIQGSLYQQLELLHQQPRQLSQLADNLHPLALNISAPAIVGRYCIVSMRGRADASLYSTGSSELLATFSNHNTPSYATCVPDTCSEDFLQSWFQRVEGKETVVEVKCTSRATVLVSDIDPKEMPYATQPSTKLSGPYHYLTNFSRINGSTGIFETVDPNTFTIGSILFCLFAAALLCTAVAATALDCFHSSSGDFGTIYPSYSAAGAADTAHSQQHQLRPVPSEANNNNNNNIFVPAAPPVYGWNVLQCFSIPQNWQRIFPQQQSTNAIPIIDGLRVVSMFWVIVVHRYMLMLITSTHPTDLLKNRENPNYWWLFNAYPSVDIFFVISGFLISVTPLPRLNMKNIISICVLRYLRLAPALIVTVWGVCTAFIHLRSGPVWDVIYAGLFGTPCSKTWWASILLMPNVYHANDMCMGHLWSMSIDWQMSLIAILMFASCKSSGSLLRRNLPLLLLTVLSIIIPGTVSLIYSLPPVPSVATLQRSLDYYNHYYVSTFCRAAPYCVGLLAGKLHLWLRINPEALTTRIVGLGHALSTAAVSAVLISPLLISSSDVLVSALHNTFAKPVFAAAIAFLIISTCHGKGGVFGWLLSRQFIGRLARCSYSVYLTSLPMQVWASATASTVPSEGIIQAYVCGGDLILCVSSGIALSLLVEMPFARLLSNAMKSDKKGSAKQKMDNSHNIVDKLGEINRRVSVSEESPATVTDNKATPQKEHHQE